MQYRCSAYAFGEAVPLNFRPFAVDGVPMPLPTQSIAVSTMFRPSTATIAEARPLIPPSWEATAPPANDWLIPVLMLCGILGLVAMIAGVLLVLQARFKPEPTDPDGEFRAAIHRLPPELTTEAVGQLAALVREYLSRTLHLHRPAAGLAELAGDLPSPHAEARRLLAELEQLQYAPHRAGEVWQAHLTAWNQWLGTQTQVQVQES